MVSHPILRSALRVTLAIGLLLGLIGAGCDRELVVASTPPAGTPPAIRVSPSIFGVGEAAPAGLITDSGTVYVTRNSVIQLIGSASHGQDGVSNFKVEVRDETGTRDMGEVAGAANASGEVPTVLRIVGAQPKAFALSTPVHVIATATTFAGVSRSIDIALQPLEPLALSINIDPAQTGPGLPATLTWNAKGATLADIVPGTPGANTVSGQVTVRRDQTQLYTLRASQPFMGPKTEFPGAGTHAIYAEKTATLTITSQGGGPQPAVTTFSGVFRFLAYSGDLTVKNEARVRIKGTTLAPGSSGLTTFDQTFGPIDYFLDGHAKDIPFSVPNVRTGTWSLTAQGLASSSGALTAVVNCTMTLPKLTVVIDTSTQSGPSCY